ncbi:hypothetical protein [Accumulibacter sp.]|uniref:hypothetical protein n=1 Tax=Accumulibacter sp. TaxID=2053492 RepID=UPI002619BCCA|nr:hypothetical protein [Accumulibacter sp.]
MAKPNYQFEKRQRELEKKKKQEEKRQRDSAARNQPGGTAVDASPVATESDQAEATGTPGATVAGTG